jgi:hypothetical protein
LCECCWFRYASFGYIFKKYFKSELTDGAAAAAGFVFLCHLSDGYILKVSLEGLKISSLFKAKQRKPVLLVLGGHVNQIRNLDVIDLARQHFVSVSCLPPHITHCMQRRGVSFMKPNRLL